MDLTVVGKHNMLLRDYRKGNWNLQETMVLIEAKRMDDDRRTRRLGEASDRGKPAELRWKWVEDYCWKNGCFRSQNQCNDKWDNLMRDFKKIRDYENKITASPAPAPERGKSYWRIEKSERKDNNLPSSMLPEIYEALLEVVERRGQRPPPPAGVSSGGQHALMPSPVRQLSSNVQAPLFLVGPPPQAPEIPGRSGGAPGPSHPLPTVDSSDTSEYSGSRGKRRRKTRGGDAGEGSSGTMQELRLEISKSASTIAEAIRSSDERAERRHNEVLSLHERRLQIEESKAEMNRQSVNGLVDAINMLANSVFALAARNNKQSPSKK